MFNHLITRRRLVTHSIRSWNASYLHTSYVTRASLGDRVRIRFVVREEEKGIALIDSSASEGEQGVSFIIGQGLVIPGLEKNVIGKAAGEKISCLFHPNDAFGFKDKRKIVKIPSKDASKWKIGSVVDFKGATARVVDNADNFITIDMNHPLSEKSLYFDIEVLDVEKDTHGRLWSGVQLDRRSEGDGQSFPIYGDLVGIKFSSKLAESGKEIEAYKDKVFQFVVGSGLVIKGLDIGVQKMSLGEISTIYIPSEFGYGSKGFDNVVPPNSNLIYNVELYSINGKVKSR